MSKYSIDKIEKKRQINFKSKGSINLDDVF